MTALMLGLRELPEISGLPLLLRRLIWRQLQDTRATSDHVLILADAVEELARTFDPADALPRALRVLAADLVARAPEYAR